jgi:hypothetical protein
MDETEAAELSPALSVLEWEPSKPSTTHASVNMTRPLQRGPAF